MSHNKENAVRIGRGSTVGLGALVVSDVGEGNQVNGVPAKPFIDGSCGSG